MFNIEVYKVLRKNNNFEHLQFHDKCARSSSTGLCNLFQYKHIPNSQMAVVLSQQSPQAIYFRAVVTCYIALHCTGVSIVLVTVCICSSKLLSGCFFPSREGIRECHLCWQHRLTRLSDRKRAKWSDHWRPRRHGPQALARWLASGVYVCGCVAQRSRERKESRHQCLCISEEQSTQVANGYAASDTWGHPRAMHWHGASRNQACHHSGHRRR